MIARILESVIAFVNAGGLGIVCLIGGACIVLRLAGAITWPWLWVTFPFWGTLAALVILIGLYVIHAMRE
jgi:hypothetical protein